MAMCLGLKSLVSTIRPGKPSTSATGGTYPTRSAGFGVGFSGVNETVMDVFKRTHLLALIGEDNIYPTMERALESVIEITHANEDEIDCPLIQKKSRNQKGVTADAYYNSIGR